MLLMEEKKINPSTRTISVLMARTFAFRRREILKNPKPLKDMCGKNQLKAFLIFFAFFVVLGSLMSKDHVFQVLQQLMQYFFFVICHNSITHSPLQLK